MLVLRSPEDFVPQNHPIRGIKKLADAALKDMTAVFDEMYADGGRHSVPPEQLRKGALLMALFSVRSERLLCEQLPYNLLVRWFLDIDIEATPFDHSTFSKNRERPHDVAREFFRRVVEQARAAGLMSSEHFTVDGTLIEAWASLKSFQPKADVEQRRKERNKRKAKSRKGGRKGPPGPSNPSVDFRGQKRSNDTHVSTTDPEARLYKKADGQTAKLSYAAHALMENRSGLLVDLRISKATGSSERTTALAMLEDELPGRRRITVGADKGYVLTVT